LGILFILCFAGMTPDELLAEFKNREDKKEGYGVRIKKGR
jgi:hypothetical protein